MIKTKLMQSTTAMSNSADAQFGGGPGLRGNAERLTHSAAQSAEAPLGGGQGPPYTADEPTHHAAGRCRQRWETL